MLTQTRQAVLESPMANALSEHGAVQATLRAAWPGLLAIYAFGSQVQGKTDAESDLDLALLLPGYADPLQLWELASQLSDAVGCPVDLLDLRAASTVMQYQVLMSGRKLCSLEPAAGLFEAFVLSEHTQLNESRAGLLADIAKNGRVYGR